MMQPITIKKRIEKARQKLYQLELQYGELRHPKVLEQSIHLDELINKYNRLIYRDYANNSDCEKGLQGVP